MVFKAGTSNVSHPGNVIFKELRLAHYDAYFNARTHASKQAAVGMIIKDVSSRGGHFLDWHIDGFWVVMKNQGLIRTMIYNAIFYFKKTIKAKMNLQVNQSSTFFFERQDGRKQKREKDGSDPPLLC